MYKVKLTTMLFVFLISIMSSSLNAWGDSVYPLVVLTVPSNGATSVETDQKVNVTFNTRMNPSTINRRTFRVVQEGSTRRTLGRMTYSNKHHRVSFEPRQPFARDTKYNVTIKGGDSTLSSVKDLDGYAMKNDFAWDFRTGPNLSTDAISPTVSFTAPSNGDSGIAINSKIIASFNQAIAEAVNSSTVTFSLKQGTTTIPGTVNYFVNTAVFSPTNNLSINSLYTATVTTQVRDLAGDLLINDYVWSFTTGPNLVDNTPPIDSTSPTVQLVSPINGSTGVITNRNFGVAFSEVIDPFTVTSTTFTLKQGTTPIQGTVTYYGVIATFNPSSSLAPNSTYTATVTNQVRDLAGNPLANNFVWNFTTGPSVQPQQATVDLGTASNFAILAGSTISSTGFTSINGDLGLSPGSTLTGFPPGSINGAQHLNDTTSSQAKLDLTTAYNNAASRTLAPITVSGNIGGQTLTPGLYKSMSALAISSGDLILNAQGDVNAVFVFQVGSSLTIASGRQVILSGGAMASNIFWQVGTSATLGTNSIFKGNILADQSINLQSGAKLDGRALARVGAVSLNSNLIIKPSP